MQRGRKFFRWSVEWVHDEMPKKMYIELLVLLEGVVRIVRLLQENQAGGILLIALIAVCAQRSK